MSELDHLDAGPVLETVQRLERRVGARFEGRGLHAVATKLAALVTEIQGASSTMTSRNRNARVASRVLVVVVLVATLAALVLGVRAAVNDGVDRGLDWLPLIEASVNDVVFAAIALYFLYSLPERIQRGESLRLLHRMRSMAHVIDMHQLSKDPERLRTTFVATRASLDPAIGSREQMEHYLDYCSEMLSLVGKAAALIAEDSRDPVVLDAVADVEALTVGMARKVWQKIMVLNDASRSH
ncbi:hypothetical protein BH11ACT8_BH11ACT8_15440 [soil metagenome]